WWSWITLRDLLMVLTFAAETPGLSGPLNAVAPQPARQADVGRALVRALSRPAFVRAPAFALRLLLGRGQADEMLLASARVRRGVLDRMGFRLADAELEPALHGLLGR